MKNTNVYNAEFRIGWMNASPDKYQRSILTINNQFPAPNIIVEQGDVINVTVINQSFEPTSIHWHGLLQQNQLHMDGVPGVTQCSILPNETFVYTLSTEAQSGTYWYHSHFAMQYGDGLKGILIIKDPHDPWKKFYQDEDIIQFSDWYHTPVYILLKPYLYPGELDPIPDTGLINGIGQFNCNLNQSCSYYRATIQIGTTKRFRIINTSVYARITLTIDQHQMRLIEVDGMYLDGNQYTRTLILNPGQRYSILVTADKNNSSQRYWIRATIHPFVDYNNNYNTSTQPNVAAILQYVQHTDENHSDIPSMDSFSNDQSIIDQSLINAQTFNDQSELIPMNNEKYRVPISDNIQTLFFHSQFQGQNPGGFYFNNKTFTHPTNRTLLSVLLYDNSTELSWPTVTHIESNQIIDIIINNIDYAPHPFHIHGHHVWILAQGNTNDGYLNETILHNINYNTNNPVYRDTFIVNPFSYLVFRLQTNNPGLWMIHCHNDWHLQIGMALVLNESPQQIKDYYIKKNLINNVPYQCHTH